MLDVVGLYPTIPHGEGLASLRKFLETSDNKKISSDTLTPLAEVVLKNNIFEIDEKIFKQKQRTAIETKFAPPYAILFMADFAEKMLENFGEKPIIWGRCIDDIFLIWEHGEESLKVYLKQVNIIHPAMKFTAEYSKQEVNFLDVNIKLIYPELETNLFVKPTDIHQFLHPTSCHPYRCKKGIPYSQALRLDRICSYNGNFDRCCNDLEKMAYGKSLQ